MITIDKAAAGGGAGIAESTPALASSGASVALIDPGDRGITVLADKVVEKIAARAAQDVDHIEGLGRRIAGRAFGSTTVRAHADVDGRVASLRLELAVTYPASVRTATRAVRRHVQERVGTLCDLHVDHIDIAVAVLRRIEPDLRRVQ